MYGLFWLECSSVMIDVAVVLQRSSQSRQRHRTFGEAQRAVRQRCLRHELGASSSSCSQCRVKCSPSLCLRVWRMSVSNLSALVLRHPQPPTASDPSGPKCPGECQRERPRKSGCPRECPWECRAPECPKGVPRVSPACQKVSGHSGGTLGTPFGHSGARTPKGPRNTPPGHSLGHPDFRGHPL